MTPSLVLPAPRSTFGVEAEDLHLRLGRHRVLRGATLTCGAGVTGLLGPNGAGKTTLLRCLATVLAPDSGSLRLLGFDPADVRERDALRMRLGYLPQDVGLPRGMTAFEYVDYVAVLKMHLDRGARHADVRRVLDEVGLADLAGRRARRLSGGERRRLGLAQALLGDPALLLLDEPTVGLDPTQRLRFRELVGRLATDRTVVLSTHQTEDVAALCDRVVVLVAGRVLFTGTPAELAGLAAGRVYRAAAAPRDAVVSYRTGEGDSRCIGEPPAGAALVAPTVEDGYLLLLHAQAAA